ncbi:hypothetical protein VNO77_17231 [Canavalia gladiata]|uniref:Dirigent protein n=1 Tax=Canavalia gladiata TaxID=3824 RepID=A0AAN9LIH5_CANGL
MFIFPIIFTFLISHASANDSPFYEEIPPTSVGLQKEKFSHFHFYFHILNSGPKPTVVEVARASITNTSASFFGRVEIADDPLTVGPELESKLVGKAQGMYGFADQEETGLVMIFNFVFTVGKFNGSTLTMVGRNLVFSPDVREMPIVGGSGVFRFARGYAQVKTYAFNATSGNSVLDYNLYVFHY